MNTENKEENIVSPEEWIKFLKNSAEKREIPYLPTQTGAKGIKIDFCNGVRVYFPEESVKQQYRLIVVDDDSNIKMFDGTVSSGEYFISQKHYFVNYALQITNNTTGEKIFQTKFNAKNKNVFINMPVQTLGDTIAWISAVERFQEKHSCKIFIKMADYIRPLFEKAYSSFTFLSASDDAKEIEPYACYTLAIFHNDTRKNETPMDYRQIPLHHVSSYILGVPVSEEPPRIVMEELDMEIPKNLVTIATHGSGGVKFWRNPHGWEEVVDFLLKKGFFVADIDRDKVVGHGILWDRIPENAADWTGKNINLCQRATQIASSKVFIGLGSGLSWLAWCCKVPVVLIGGFSEPWCEFKTPYRIYNRNLCHGCFNDTSIVFDHDDYLWCPRHKNTSRHWECSLGISSKMVINELFTIPEISKKLKKGE